MTEYPYKNVIEPVGGSNGNGQTTGSYEYPDSGWYDRLKKYNGEGIAYDNIGNPLNWKVGMTNLNWTAGRQLCSLDVDSTAVSYTYTPGGTRTSKTVGGVKTEYLLDGGLIMQQKTGDEILNFYYDSAGQVVSLGYKANANAAELFYFFSRNLQGDVVSIYNSIGSTLVGTYTYDAWGRILSIKDDNGADVSGNAGHIMNINPIRYRGYYYDNETGFYYLQSRYYDPEVKRFINADGLVSTGTGAMGYNMFAYCNNNPVNMVDPSGTCSSTAIGKWDCGKWNCPNSGQYKKPVSQKGGTAPQGHDPAQSTGQSIVQQAKQELASGNRASHYDMGYSGAEWCGFFAGHVLKKVTGFIFPYYDGVNNWTTDEHKGNRLTYYEDRSLGGIRPGDFIIWDDGKGNPQHINIFIGDDMYIGGNEPGVASGSVSDGYITRKAAGYVRFT